MGTHKLLPCPFCGCTTVRSFHVFGSGRYRVDCNACNGGLEANNPERAISLWNLRSDRAGHISGLREAAEWHEAEAEKVQPAWPALASIEVPDAEALAIRRDISGHNRWSAMVFRARITALEEEGRS